MGSGEVGESRRAVNPFSLSEWVRIPPPQLKNIWRYAVIGRQPGLKIRGLRDVWVRVPLPLLGNCVRNLREL